MTPQEKAKEILDKYLYLKINLPFIDVDGCDSIASGEMTYKSAKQCALIAVSEILIFCNKKDMAYWYEVKSEITKL